MTEPTFQHADVVTRRVMFALELIDPGRGLPAGKEMTVSAEGLAQPSMTRAGQFVWTDLDPRAKRNVKVKATSVRGWFQSYEETIQVPAREDGVPVKVERVPLIPTGLYEPPAGCLAAAGMLVDVPDPKTRKPVKDVTVVLEVLAKDDDSVLQSQLEATTDVRGGFIAMASDFRAQSPRPAAPPAAANGLVGWLAFTRGGETRFSDLLPLRRGRLLRIPDPLAWTDLAVRRPQPPP